MDGLSKPLSIESIASKYTLPVVIRSALGLRGSSRPIILHSISNVTFAFGRALTLKVHQSKKHEYQSFRPIDSEIVAIPLQYPGYFECLLPSSRGSEDGVMPETSIRPIIERMEIDHRPQKLYTTVPMRMYTLETKGPEVKHRIWDEIEAHQTILIEQLTYIEYTPTANDNITPEDYEYAWWICFFKRLKNRNEYVMKCILSNQRICYIPCSSTDEVCLFPVGQLGSTNFYKLQPIQNLIEQFPLPMNIKFVQFPGFEAYKDFSGYIQLLGLFTKEFAVCASLSSTNVCFIPTKTRMKFVVTPIPLTSVEIINQLSNCQMFIQSFDMQLHRILISSHEISTHRSRSKTHLATNRKRSASVEQEAHNIEIENDYRSGASTEKKRTGLRKQRAITTGVDNFPPQQPIKRALSTDNNAIYNSLIHPIQPKNILKLSSSLLPKKQHNIHHLSTPFTYDTGSDLMNDMDLPNANGAIFLDNNNELFSSIKSDTRLS